MLLEQTEAEAVLKRLLQAAGTVPSEDDLDRIRADRDRAWRLIRGAWEGNRLPTIEAVRDLLGPDRLPVVTPEVLAGCFERLKDEADLQADRLRREIERVTEQAAAQASLYKARQRAGVPGERGAAHRPPRRGAPA